MILRNNIKAILAKKNISIMKLGEAIGLTYHSTHRIVTTDNLFSTKLGNIVEIAKFLDVGVEKLYEEEIDMEKIIINCLEKLNEVHLLGEVGRKIVEEPKKFEITLEDMTMHFEGYTEDMVMEHLSTSSLVGADDELAIQEWIAEEEI